MERPAVDVPPQRLLNQSDTGGEHQRLPIMSGTRTKTGRIGVFRRDAAGGEWQHVLSDLEDFTGVVHPRQPALVLAGTADGVWRSEGRGATFARADLLDTGKQIWSFLQRVEVVAAVAARLSPHSPAGLTGIP